MTRKIGMNSAKTRAVPSSDGRHRREVVTTLGVPDSLGPAALDGWLGQMSTPDEGIAEFIGWRVEKVRQYR